MNKEPKLTPDEAEGLIPALRFPEFVGEYREEALGYLCDYWNGKGNEGIVSIDGKYLLISLNSIDIEGNLKNEMKRVPHTDNSLNKGDLVMVLSDVAYGDFLGLTAIIPDENYVLNQRMAGLRIKRVKEIDPQYLRFFIIGNQKYFKKKGQGSSQKNLSKASVVDFPVLIPPRLFEQQKIASCLSSLDALIAAHSDRLRALQDHKKGLMQNLFPQEGETVPKLRFKEFVGEYREEALGYFCDYWNGKGNEGIVSIDGKYLLISLNSIDIEGNLKNEMKRVPHTDNSLNKGDLVMVLSDVAYGDFLGLTAIIPDENYVLNQRMAGLRIKRVKEIDPQYLRFFIIGNQKYFKKKGQGSSQKNLSKASVVDFPVLIPPRLFEQQKIASCLSSLDALITAQADKIAQLQAHKKGLMQGMFPKIEN